MPSANYGPSPSLHQNKIGQVIAGSASSDPGGTDSIAHLASLGLQESKFGNQQVLGLSESALSFLPEVVTALRWASSKGIPIVSTVGSNSATRVAAALEASGSPVYLARNPSEVPVLVGKVFSLPRQKVPSYENWDGVRLRSLLFMLVDAALEPQSNHLVVAD
eukprot:CAMPEP_0184298012 /NCGR_PEP_ID=MMETSP1049-20130417/8884_1 /TAXON_ID=77928 /ORGANISM="Proteomonas sulcata, Strain CCMP704" /LENGTH=162 /DNA_ID=CAMNT_0026608005 /DNA_START=153 /DNA_END=642 /DNA_ORIENTATION=+